MTYAAARRDRP